eukprot:Gb_10664 [translate_table: standard]
MDESEPFILASDGQESPTVSETNLSLHGHISVGPFSIIVLIPDTIFCCLHQLLISSHCFSSFLSKFHVGLLFLDLGSQVLQFCLSQIAVATEGEIDAHMTMGQTNNRRALGDIGNLVGALSTRCTVSKGVAAASSENNVGAANNFAAVDRPVTRKFGATLAKNQLLTQVVEEPEEHMKWGAKQRRTMSSAREKNHSKREVQNAAVPMEDCKALEEQEHVPCVREIITRSRAALLKNENETMIISDQDEDKGDCCEMEMDMEEHPMPNIDEADEGNPMAVVDYVEDIYTFYRQAEVLSCVPPDYMSHQCDINEKMRAILIDWLIEVHLKFDLMHETLFLAINLIDRYLSSQKIVRKSLQLVGVTAMLLACKYEEICVPIVEDFVTISDRAYTRNEVLQMEKSMLNTLQFNITVPTPYVFMNRFLKAAESDNDLEMVAFFLVELCLVEYIMLRYPPSMLAAAAVYTGQCILKKVPSWTKTLKNHTTYAEDQLLECAKLMVGFHQNSGKGKLTGVHRKYLSSKFGSAAKLEPAVLS